MRNSISKTNLKSISSLAHKHLKRWSISTANNANRVDDNYVFFENRICFTVSETAYALGVSPKSVERLIKSGEIKSKRAGRRVLIPRCDIEAWLNRKE